MNSLKRTFHVLDLLAGEPEGLPFNELRRRCNDLAPTTMSRMLQALLADELLDKDKTTGNYVLGGSFLALSRKALGVQSRAEMVKPEVNALAAATCESAAFFDLTGSGMTLIAKTEKDESFHYSTIGTHWGPLPNDPFGWACLAFREDLDMAGKVDAAMLARLRADGCLAVHRDLRGEVLRVVAPVFANGSGQVVGTIGITAINRAEIGDETESLKQKVKAAAARLSRRIVI